MQFGSTHLLPLRLRVLAPAKVAQSPGSIPQHRQLVVLIQQQQQRLQCSSLEDVIPASRRVTGNVTQGPDTAGQFHALTPAENTYACSRTSKTLDDSSSMNLGTAPFSITTLVWLEVPDAISRRQLSPQVLESWKLTRQCPGRLELEHVIGTRQELHKARDNPTVDHAVDRGVLLLREKPDDQQQAIPHL